MRRHTVAVDFDGVLHSYTSPWVNARTISDIPVPGSIEWLVGIVDHFDVAIQSTRNFQFLGVWAMRRWLRKHLEDYFWSAACSKEDNWSHADVDDDARRMAHAVLSKVSFPRKKVPALIYLDDRAIRFEGSNWPTREDVFAARPWNKPKAKDL